MSDEPDASSGMARIDSMEFWDPEDTKGAAGDGEEDDRTSTTSTTSSSDGFRELAELSMLLEGVEIDEEGVFHDAMDDHDQWYGKPLSPENALDQFPPSPSSNGLRWKSEVLPAIWYNEKTGKLRQSLQKRDFDVTNSRIKPHRKTLPLTHDELLSSLTQTPCGRYIFHGKLNGWPSLTVLELIAVERKRPLLLSKAQYTPHWTPEDGAVPEFEDSIIYRATFSAPAWTSIGWSEASPGYCYWFEATQQPTPRFSYGTNMLHTVSDALDRVSHVHMISHRYAVRIESPRDKITYHSVVLLEWEHGEYCTVVEGAYLNGMGGYKCKSNWYEDSFGETNLMSQYMPDELIGPWITTATEMRCFDVPARNLEEFKEYLNRHEGNKGRFIDPQVTFSHPARITFRTKQHVAQYLLNYVGRDCSYQELKTNCQTLAADLCAFLAGKKRVDPFHPIVKMEYRNRTHQFLYDSNMYAAKKKLQKTK